MPTTPISGRISSSDIYNLATDCIYGGISKSNLSLKNVAHYIRFYGQPNPNLSETTNIAYSAFLVSNIMGIRIDTTRESPTTYGGNNDGVIYVEVRDFKMGRGGTDVTVTVVGVSSETKSIYGGLSDVYIFEGISSGVYTVNVRDNVTGRSQDLQVTVTFNGGSDLVTKNWISAIITVTAQPETPSTYSTNNNGYMDISVLDHRASSNGNTVTVSCNNTSQTKVIQSSVGSIFTLGYFSSGTYNVNIYNNSTGISYNMSIVIPYGGGATVTTLNIT